MDKGKHVDEQKWYWVGNIFDKRAKRPKHVSGIKWFWVRWDYKTNCQEFWLIYTESAAEDDELLADDDSWVRVTRDWAIDLTKRGGQRQNTALGAADKNNWDWLWHIITEAQRDNGRHWLPVFPFKVDSNANYKIKDRVVVKA